MQLLVITFFSQNMYSCFYQAWKKFPLHQTIPEYFVFQAAFEKEIEKKAKNFTNRRVFLAA